MPETDSGLEKQKFGDWGASKYKPKAKVVINVAPFKGKEGTIEETWVRGGIRYYQVDLKGGASAPSVGVEEDQIDPS